MVNLKFETSHQYINQYTSVYWYFCIGNVKHLLHLLRIQILYSAILELNYSMYFRNAETFTSFITLKMFCTEDIINVFVNYMYVSSEFNCKLTINLSNDCHFGFILLNAF